MRLFVAVDLPDDLKTTLLRLQTDIPTARWSNRHQMHLTLFFIGETDQIAAVKAALEKVQLAPFDWSLAGVGRFPPGKRQPPRILWAGVEAPAALGALHAQVATALASLGFVTDERPFSPHITLARLKTNGPLPAVDAFLDQHRAFRAGPAAVSEFVLFSSELSPQGARYRREAVYPLRG